MLKLKLFGFALVASVAYSLLASHAALADVTALSPYSWDPGLYATTARYDDGAHSWGQRKTGGAWGTGPVNYQSGATTSYRGNSSGSMSVVLEGTYCPRGACQYGGGS